jgi:hypothetical protein
MDTLLIAVIVLASILGIVLIVSISSLLFVQSKYSTLKAQQAEDEEIGGDTSKSAAAPTYTLHSIYSIKPPKIDDINAYRRMEEVYK